MCARSPNTFNVTNPGRAHTVRMTYGQQLSVMMLPPAALDLPPDGKWVLKLNSHFLKHHLTNIVNKKSGNYTNFLLGQVNTKKQWQFVSHFFLGNIHIFLQRANEPHMDHYATICAFLDCKNDDKKDIVTVVNPISQANYHQSVKLEPRQILELVVADDEVRDQLEWRPYVFPLTIQQLAMEQVHHEYLPGGDLYGSLSKDGETPYYCERRIFSDNLSELSECPNTVEHHFFFKFANIPHELIQVLPNGVQLACNINLVGKKVGESEKCKERQLFVNFSLRRAIRAREEQMVNSPKAAPKEFSPTERIFDAADRRLINPRKTEQIYMFGDGDVLILEIAKPAVYFSRKAAGLNEASWRAKTESAHLHNTRANCIKVKDHTLKYIGGKPFQRFKIELNDCPEVHDEMILGKVILSCRELDKIVPESDRQLFILLKKPAPFSNFMQVKCGGSTYNVSNRKHRAGRRDHDSHDNCGTTTTRERVYSNYSIKHRNRKATGSYLQTQYHEVTITDCGNGDDLKEGELYEYLSYAGGPQRALIPYTPQSTRSVAGHYDGTDCDDKNTKKKSRSEQTGQSAKNSNGKSSLVCGKRKKNDNKPSSADVWRRPSDVNNDTSIPAIAERPMEINRLRDKQTIVMERGRPLIIKLMLPKGNFRAENIRRMWTPNVLNTMQKDGFTVWVEHCKVIESEETNFVHQQIKIKPLTPRGLTPGRYRVGALRLDDGNGKMKMVYLDLQVRGEDEDREPLTWWKNYWIALSRSRPLSFGTFPKFYQTDMRNRTTLRDPIGKTIDVPITGKSHEIEIILSYPQTAKYAEAKEKWSITANMIEGRIKYLDYTEYKLWDGTPIYRALFKVERDKPRIFGEIKIMWNGEDTHTRICPFSQADSDKKCNVDFEKKVDNNRVKIAGSPDDPAKVRFENWKNGDRVTISPTEHPYIKVPETTTVLADRLRHEAKHSPWQIRVLQVPLDKEVWAKLAPQAQTEINCEAPYYANCGLFASGDEPWEYKEFVLRPLEETQPLIHEILSALQAVHGPTAHFPIADIVFRHEINSDFVLQRSLRLSVTDPLFETKYQDERVAYNPVDQSKIALEHGTHLSIRLPYKWRHSSVEGMEYIEWRCVEAPPWMLRLDYEDDIEEEQEVYNFAADLDAGIHKATGTLVFDCGDGYLRKKLTVMCTR